MLIVQKSNLLFRFRENKIVGIEPLFVQNLKEPTVFGVRSMSK